jgi:PAS domain S-box-containing protein
MSTSQGKYPGTYDTEGKLPIVKRIVRWRHSPHPTWTRLNRIVAGAHPSVTETGERRRAELSAWIAILLAFLFAVGGLATVLNRGQVDLNTWVMVILAGVSLSAYGISRTRHYAWGGWLITGSLVITGYLFVILGIGDEASLNSFIPLAFVLGSILLAPWALLFWVLVGTYTMFFLPASLITDAGTLVGIFQSIGALLLVAVIFRNNVERRRLAELRGINTELQQANSTVEASSRRTRTVFQTLSEGVGVTDPAGNLVEVNDSLLRLAGYRRPEELLGKSAALLVAESERDRLAQNFSFGGDLGKAVEYPMMGQDGRPYDGELTVSVLQDERGQRTGFVLVVRDITLQKQASEAISQSEARQRQILDTIPASIFITRLPGGEILYVNQTTVDQFGLLPEQISGQTTPDLYYDPEDRDRLLAILRDQGNLTNFVARAKRQDNGQPFWGDLSGHMIDYGGERALLTAIIDITARRQAEESLLARDQMLQKNSLVIGDLSRSSNITSGDLEAALREITEAASQALGVSRTSVWFYTDERDQILCADLFEIGKGHSSGVTMSDSDYPAFFATLQSATTIAADDAHAHPATREFSQGYLTPLGINSMLDAPIRLRGRVVGVLCCEHTGPKRHWTLEEENFSTSIVDFVTTAIDAQERVKLARQIEESYKRRGVQVQLSTQIAQEISGATELNELFHRVVVLVKEQFGYYHTQLLRYEETQNAMVLIEGYGEVGAQMLQVSHRMPMGTGLIGTAAATGETVMRAELSNDPDWRPNPLLPDTQGEIAVPIKLRGQVLGVLDVQSNQAGALTQDDQILLEGLCGQVAVAIEETRLRQEMEERLQELNALYASMSREGWESVKDTYQIPGYMYDRVSVLPLTAEMDESQSVEGDSRQIVTKMLESEKYMVAPLAIHGSEQIGAVSVEDNTVQPLSEEDKLFVEQVAEQVALALESARLFAQTQNTLGETEDLYRGSAELSVASNYDEVLDAIRKTVDKAQEAHILSIGLFDHPWTDASPAESVDVIATWSSLPAEAVAHFPRHFSVSESPMTMALKPNEPSVVEDAMTDPELDPQIRGMLLNALSTRSAINAPLTVGGQWLGFMSISYPQPKKFSEADMRRLTALTGQAATVIQSLRLFQQTQDALAETQALYTLASRISAARDLQEIVAVAAEETHIPDMNRALLLVYDHDAKGEIESSEVRANWYSGHGAQPVPVGTHFGVGSYAGQFQSFSMTEPTFVDATDESFRAVGIGSLASLPLWVGGQIAGTLSLISEEPHAFTEQEKRPMSALAQQVAIALQSRLLFEQVQRNREQLSGALQIANMGYADIDAHTQIITLSDEYYQLLRTSAEQEGGSAMPWAAFAEKFMQAEDYIGLQNTAQTAVKAKQNEFEAEHLVRCVDGEMRWLRTQYSIVRNDQGEPVRFLGAAQDITERKQTREALARRARELSTVADLGTRISAVLDPTQMLQTVTDLVKDSFALYHAHIYLLNEKGDILNLTCGAGEVGRQMVKQGWQIPLDQERSLVARAARARQGVIVNNVQAEAGFMPNELLPDTRAEMAVPLMVGERVLGVMDIQSTELNRFTDEDVSIQTVLASQVAVALQNARTYAQTQRQAEYEALINSISQKIQSTTSVENALQVAVRELGRALGAARTSVQLNLGKADKVHPAGLKP